MNFKRYKGRGSKKKEFSITKEAIVDQKNKPLCRIDEIHTILLGKQSSAFTSNKKLDKKPHCNFLTLNEDIDLEANDSNTRNEFAVLLLMQLQTIGIVPTTPNVSQQITQLKEDDILTITFQQAKLDKNQFAFIKYKNKGSKRKLFALTEYAIDENNGEKAIEYSSIDSIVCGKESAMLKKHKKAQSQSDNAFMEINFGKHAVSIGETKSGERNEFAIALLQHMQQVKLISSNLDNVFNKINQLQGDVFRINVADFPVENNEDEVKIDDIASDDVAQRKSLVFDKNIVTWEFKRYKDKGSKQRKIQLENDCLLWDNKSKFKFNELLAIKLGKQSEILMSNKKTKNKSNKSFVVLKFDEGGELCLEETNANDRIDLVLKIIDRIAKMKPARMPLNAQYYTALMNLGNDDVYTIEFNNTLAGNNKSAVSDSKSNIIVNENEEESLVRQFTQESMNDFSRMYLEQQNKELTEEKHRLVNENNSLKQENSELQHEIRLSQKTMSENSRLKDENDILKTDIESFKTRVSELQYEVRTSISTHQGLVEELNTTKEKHAISEEKDKTIEDLTQRLSRQSSEIDSLKDEVRKWQQKNKNDIQTHRMSISELQEENDKLKAMSAQENHEKEEKLKEERFKYIRKVKAIVTDAQWVTFRNLMKDVANHSRQLNNLNEDLDSYSAQREEFIQDVIGRLRLILNNYPTKSHQLISKFEILIPNESERYVFQQNVKVELSSHNMHLIDASDDPLNIANIQQINQEFQNKLNEIEQEVKQEQSLNRYSENVIGNDDGLGNKVQQLSISNHSVASVLNVDKDMTVNDTPETMMKLHGISNTYKLKVVLGEEKLSIGGNAFGYEDIFKIEIGDSSLFHGNADKHCCMVLLTAQGSIQLETESRECRDKWMRFLQHKAGGGHIINIENWNVDVSAISPTV